MLTLNREIKLILLRDFFGIIIGIRMPQVYTVFIIHFQYPDPMHLRIPGLVIFFNTSIHTLATTDATGDIERISKENAFLGRGRTDGDLAVEFLGVSPFPFLRVEASFLGDISWKWVLKKLPSESASR